MTALAHRRAFLYNRGTVRKYLAILCIALPLAACSSTDSFQADVPTDAPPIIDRVDPNAGSTGDPITIFGFGFSTSIPENIVIIGGAAISATSYRLLDNPTDREIEAITVDVPEGAELGEGPIYVQVHGNQSNSDVSFTVTP
jgi:hypothetical protein